MLRVAEVVERVSEIGSKQFTLTVRWVFLFTKQWYFQCTSLILGVREVGYAQLSKPCIKYQLACQQDYTLCATYQLP